MTKITKTAPVAKAPAAVAPSVALTRANTALLTTVGNVEKVITDLRAMVAASEAIAIRIEDQNAESAALAEANADSRRRAAAELELAILEDRSEVTATLLAESGLARITQAEVDALRSDLAAKNAADDAELKKAVAIAVAGEQRDAKAAAAQVDATNKVSMAQKDATITMQAEKISFLQSQVVQLQGQIDADRQTRLEIAKADSQRQGVTVNNGK